MQRIEITDCEGLKIHCPFCGTLALSDEGCFTCEHTLFIASDEGGFEYVSAKLNLSEDTESEEQSMDELTDALEYPNSVKFAIYQPAPSFFGGYIGFALK